MHVLVLAIAEVCVCPSVRLSRHHDALSKRHKLRIFVPCGSVASRDVNPGGRWAVSDIWSCSVSAAKIARMNVLILSLKIFSAGSIKTPKKLIAALSFHQKCSVRLKCAKLVFGRGPRWGSLRHSPRPWSTGDKVFKFLSYLFRCFIFSDSALCHQTLLTHTYTA